MIQSWARWWRRLFAMLGQRLGERDLDKSKRACTIQLVDRFDAPAAEHYANAIARQVADDA